MDVHLFSSPGESQLVHIVEACRVSLRRQPHPVVAYVPAPCVQRFFVDMTRAAFADLAEVRVIDVEQLTREEVAASLALASMIYVPGGNTYLLSHRLHRSGVFGLLRERVIQGVPFVGFSAGAVMCGPTVLTTSDINCCACTTFSGFGFLPYQVGAHYRSDVEESRVVWGRRLQEFHVFNDTPVLMLEDSAYVRVLDGSLALVRGVCWRFERDQPPVQLPVGRIGDA